MTMAKNIMIQGTMSNAGKSLLCAGLCRVFRQDGYRVAPFKSQNMALNSFITADGGEMGRAQVVQAEAAGIAPDVRMNPILLKPTTDVGSQVIVSGQVKGNMRAMEYYRRKREFVPDVLEAFGFRVCPSSANYLLFQGPTDLHVKLKKQGIAIRSCDNYPGLTSGWYRIAVRRHEENEALIAAIGSIVKEGK